ncbi:MAG: type II toxin-antitoxin system HicB family antitoxin [Thermodesulfovibrionales bacterium]
MNINGFIFTGIVYRDGESYSSLCPELDVASQGDTKEEAEKALLEAVTLYLETAFESNLPYLRPIPSDEDPRIVNPESVLKVFNLKIDFKIKAYA